MRSKIVRGFIDGALSTLGIVIGAMSATSSVILAAAIGGALANGISNLLSALSAATTERYSELREIERAMVTKDLRGGTADRRVSREAWLDGLADGLSTIFGGAIPIIPYLFAPPGTAAIIAVVAVVLATFGMGLYLGKVSRRNLLFSGLKMAMFAVIVAVVVYFIEELISP